MKPSNSILSSRSVYILLLLIYFTVRFSFSCGANIISTRQEVSIGTNLAQEIEDQIEPFGNDDWNDYVDMIGRRIVSVCGRQDIEYSFTIIDDSTSVNAFALPGGYLYVYTGLILRAENEAELAGVLAHEVGHVVGKHGMKKMTSMIGYQLLLRQILGSDPGFIERAAADFTGGIGFANYGRHNESEADAYAIQYLFEAGYDPNAFVTFLEKLGKLRVSNPSIVEKLLSTHPQPFERIAEVQNAIRLLQSGTELELGAEVFMEKKKNLYK